MLATFWFSTEYHWTALMPFRFLAKRCYDLWVPMELPLEQDYLPKTLDCTVRTPVFGRHQFFGTSEHYGNTHGSLLSGWMNYNYTACCWFPTSSNILILPSQFWQISFESYWLHCSKCWILVLWRYKYFNGISKFHQYGTQASCVF